MAWGSFDICQRRKLIMAGSHKVLEAWVRLKGDLDDIKNREEMILIMGDMNRSIGANRWGVSGNSPHVSQGGKLIRGQLLMTEKFTLLNSMKLAEGGPFTWVQPKKEEGSSFLNLAMALRNLVPFVRSMVIYCQREFTPRRIKKCECGLIP